MAVIAQSNRRLVNIRTASEILGLSHWTLREWAYKGKIASHKVSNRLLFDTVELDRIINESERPRLVSRGTNCSTSAAEQLEAAS